MVEKRFFLQARVSTENPRAVKPVLERLVPGGSVLGGEDRKEFRVEGELSGASARDLNRAFLSSLRQVEKRTRLRSEWSCDGVSERFFDYVPRGKKPAPTDAVSP
jgi:hypothetical protein